jgi:hydroxypyruvate isomerase
MATRSHRSDKSSPASLAGLRENIATMPRFAANISYLFAEHDFLDRFAAARRAGFSAVEFHFPYGYPAAEIADVSAAADVEIVLFNLPPGDWTAGERGIACQPARMGEFQDGVGVAIEYAKALGVSRLNCLAGLHPAGISSDRARLTLLENLRFAALTLARENIALVMEPISTRDMPGFFVSTPRQALALIDAVGSDNLKLQYDLYHAQVMEGNLAATLQENLVNIGHIQLADVPGRHEPGSGEINFAFLFDHLDRIGYAGWIGCEYQPATTTEAGLIWIKPWRQSWR